MTATTTWTRAACVGLVLAQGCVAAVPLPLGLPPRGAPLEERVAAYHGRAAMPHFGMNGWEMRLGEGPVEDLSLARAFLANAPEAEAELHGRDRQLALAWGLLGAGLAVILSSLIVLPLSLDGSRGDTVPTLPFMLIGLGTALSIPPAFILGSAQRRVPVAAEAYNRWLWRSLDLPVGGAGRAARPALSPAPWSEAR